MVWRGLAYYNGVDRSYSTPEPVTTGMVTVTGQRIPSVHTDCETVGMPPLMPRKTLGILDGGRGRAVDRWWRRRGIKGVDKGGA